MSHLHDLILATYRQHVLKHIMDNPHFSIAQQQQLAERVAHCFNRHKLGRWIGEARQEAHSRRVCNKAAQEVRRDLAAVVRYVRDEETGRVLLLPTRQYPQHGQVVWLALNQN